MIFDDLWGGGIGHWASFFILFKRLQQKSFANLRFFKKKDIRSAQTSLGEK